MLSNVIKWKLRLIGEGGEINNRSPIIIGSPILYFIKDANEKN